jgi:uncharacterized Zn-finger protein
MATTHMMVLNPSRLEPERYNCPSCSKSFVRKAHMLRHQQQRTSMIKPVNSTHSLADSDVDATQKPFNCTFCNKSFKRR